MPRKKKPFVPLTGDLLVWAQNLANVNNIDYTDLQGGDDDYDDQYDAGDDYDDGDDYDEDEYADLEDKFDPLMKAKQKDPVKKDTTGELRKNAKARVKELGVLVASVCDGMPLALGKDARKLKSNYEKLAADADENADDWPRGKFAEFDKELDILTDEAENLAETRRRLDNHMTRVKDRVAALNDRAIEVRHQAPTVLNEGIDLLAIQYRELESRAKSELPGMDQSGLWSFEKELDAFVDQSDALEALFDTCSDTSDFTNWASTQKGGAAAIQVGLMNNALKTKPPDLKAYCEALVELEKLRDKSENEIARERKIAQLEYMLTTITNALAQETETGLHDRKKWEKERKELHTRAVNQTKSVASLRQKFRKLDDETFVSMIENLVKNFKSLELAYDQFEFEVEEVINETASRQHIKQLNKVVQKPATILRTALNGAVTGFIVTEAIPSVSAKIKKWDLYHHIVRVWNGSGENRSGPKTSVLHHHCNSYKHNLLYDGTIILGLVDGHMEKDALDSIDQQEIKVAGRKGKPTTEVCLTATDLLTVI